MKIMLYSNNCPRCNILKKKLIAKNIPFEEFNDIQIMIDRGFAKVPMPLLEVDGQIYDFKEANDWINEVQNED